jgi:hypothetical protein
MDNSIAWNPAAEIAASFFGRVCSSRQPMEQEAYASGILSRFSMTGILIVTLT